MIYRPKRSSISRLQKCRFVFATAGRHCERIIITKTIICGRTPSDRRQPPFGGTRIREVFRTFLFLRFTRSPVREWFPSETMQNRRDDCVYDTCVRVSNKKLFIFHSFSARKNQNQSKIIDETLTIESAPQ